MLEHFKKKYIDKEFQFVSVDTDGKITDCNESFLSLRQGGSIFDLHPFFEILRTLNWQENRETNFNCIHLDSNGAEFIVDISVIGQKEGWQIVIKDLTQHYNDYQSAAQTRNESIINSELIALKNVELLERERFKNQFIQNFSHELRNPLTSSISIAHLLEGTSLNHEQREMLDFLKGSHMHLKTMLEDTLNIGMIASGKLALREKDFDFFRLFELLEFTYRAKAKQKELEFDCSIDEKIPELVRGDRLRIYQVLANLLENAIKYTEEGTVSFHIKLNQRWANTVNVRFKVSDTGYGIAEKDLPKIFDSFSQLQNNAKQTGVGLGLAVVKGLLEILGSEIKVSSIVGKGTNFYFDLNLKFSLNLTSSQGRGKSSKNTGRISEANTGKKFNMLIVEDDGEVQTVLFKTLVDSGHFYIDLVSDGAKVMERLIDHRYDIILMDVNLPNTNGDQITKLIRDFPFKNIKNIPIVGITANAYQEDVDGYLKKGMNAVLIKPFETEVLKETIFKLLK